MTCFISIRVTVSWNNFLLNLPAWDLSFYLRRRSEYLPDIILTSFFPRNNFRASSRIYCLSTSVSAAVVACHCRANRKIRRYNDRTFLLNIGSTSFAFYKLWSWRKSLNIILLAKTNNILHVSLHQLDPKLVIYRARAWTTRFSRTFSKWQIVRVKTPTKAFFFEEISINSPKENLPKLNKERFQNFCHALKLNVRSRHSASASNCSMNRSLEPKRAAKMIIIFYSKGSSV